MNKYSGTVLFFLCAVLFGYAIWKTIPAKTVTTEFGEIPVVDNQSLPVASILNSACAANDPDLFVVQPKGYQTISDSNITVSGQAVGAFENVVQLELKNLDTGTVLNSERVSVEAEFPCTFKKDVGLGGLSSGSYSIRASLRSANNDKIVKEVEVPIRIE